MAGIEKLSAFFHSIGLGTRLSDLHIPQDRIDEMAGKCTEGGTQTVGNFVKLDRPAVKEILLLAGGVSA
jgi:alcohol dehydrogenase YqhD (iron-dependent ADH family)